MHTNTLNKRRTILSSFHGLSGNTGPTYTRHFLLTTQKSAAIPIPNERVGADTIVSSPVIATTPPKCDPEERPDT